MSPVRTILIATPYFWPRVGGLENYAHAIASGLAREGDRVVIVCGDHVPRLTKQVLSVQHSDAARGRDKERREAYSGVRQASTDDSDDAMRAVVDATPTLNIYRLPIWKVVSNTPVNPLWPLMLRRIIKTERPDVINAHTPVPFMVDAVAWAAGRTPLIVTYHAATLFKPSSLVFKLIAACYLPVQRLTLGKAKRIIAVSPYVKASFSSRLQHKTVVVPNATNPSLPLPAGRPAGLVFVANLEPTHAWKGLDLILESLAVMQQSGAAPSLTVIGDGADRPRYEAKVRDLGLSHSVTFLGRLVGAQRDRAMAKSLALIAYPTTANDAFPTVFLEAWALGIPVLAAKIGPIPDLIGEGLSGRLAEPNNPAALAEVINRVLADPEGARAMGSYGRGLVQREYNWPVQVARTRKLLEQVS